MTEINRQFVLRSRPKGLIAPGDLQLAEAPLPTISDGQALARVKYLSIDQTMRVWMAADTYLPAARIAEWMGAAGLAEVGDSRHADFRKGNKGVGLARVADYCGMAPPKK